MNRSKSTVTLRTGETRLVRTRISGAVLILIGTLVGVQHDARAAQPEPEVSVRQRYEISPSGLGITTRNGLPPHLGERGRIGNLGSVVRQANESRGESHQTRESMNMIRERGLSVYGSQNGRTPGSIPGTELGSPSASPWERAADARSRQSGDPALNQNGLESLTRGLPRNRPMKFSQVGAGGFPSGLDLVGQDSGSGITERRSGSTLKLEGWSHESRRGDGTTVGTDYSLDPAGDGQGIVKERPYIIVAPGDKPIYTGPSVVRPYSPELSDPGLFGVPAGAKGSLEREKSPAESSIKEKVPAPKDPKEPPGAATSMPRDDGGGSGGGELYGMHRNPLTGTFSGGPRSPNQVNPMREGNARIGPRVTVPPESLVIYPGTDQTNVRGKVADIRRGRDGVTHVNPGPIKRPE